MILTGHAREHELPTGHFLAHGSGPVVVFAGAVPWPAWHRPVGKGPHARPASALRGTWRFGRRGRWSLRPRSPTAPAFLACSLTVLESSLPKGGIWAVIFMTCPSRPRESLTVCIAQRIGPKQRLGSASNLPPSRRQSANQKRALGFLTLRRGLWASAMFPTSRSAGTFAVISPRSLPSPVWIAKSVSR